jgi:uncharacterized protein YjbI with pentapeptide repeats
MDLDLRGMVAQGATFLNCSFTRCKMDQALLQDAKLLGTVFFECSLRQAAMVSWIKSTDFVNCEMDQAQLLGAQIEDSRFMGTRLEYSIFTRATLKNVRFEDCALHGAHLDLADSEWVEFPGSNLWGAVVPISCAFFRGTTFDKRSMHMFLGLLSHTEGNDNEREQLRTLVEDRYLRAVGRLVNAEINGEGLPQSENESGSVHNELGHQGTEVGIGSDPQLGARHLAG